MTAGLAIVDAVTVVEDVFVPLDEIIDGDARSSCWDRVVLDCCCRSDFVSSLSSPPC